MKRFTLLAALGLCSISLFAQDAQKEEPKEEGFVFTTVKELHITSVKNQSRAGTCWCYSSMAFLESELNRTFSLASISCVILSRSYSGFHPHSSRAQVSSSEFGHDSAIA